MKLKELQDATYRCHEGKDKFKKWMPSRAGIRCKEKGIDNGCRDNIPR